MNPDPQSEKYKRTLSDIKKTKTVDTSFSKKEDRANLKQRKSEFKDYPTEILIILVLIVLAILLFVSNTL